MPELNPRHLEAVLKIINQGPYFRLLSMPVKEIGPGYSLVEVALGQEHLNPFGGAHGGVYASAIDTAAYWAVYCEIEEGTGMITLDVKVDLLAPVSGGTMRVEGKRIKLGRTICLAEATAYDSQGRCLAHGTSKMMISPGIQTMRDAFAAAGAGELPPKFLADRP